MDETEYNVDALINAIKLGRPVIVGGYYYRTHIIFGIYLYEGGHFWVCDHLIIRTREKKGYSDGKLVRTEKEEQKLLHCNWGWNGDDNGYYLPTRFDTNKRIDPETTRGTEGFFQYDITMWDRITR